MGALISFVEANHGSIYGDQMRIKLGLECMFEINSMKPLVVANSKDASELLQKISLILNPEFVANYGLSATRRSLELWCDSERSRVDQLLGKTSPRDGD